MSSISSLLLTGLTPELLGKITEYCPGESLFRLLCAGSSILRTKLTSTSGARRMDIWRPNLQLLPECGSLIMNFRGIRTLRIILAEMSGSCPSINSNTLKSLPSTLQTISFRFLEAEECWIRPYNRERTRPFVRDGNCPSFNFELSFPQLSYLKLICSRKHHSDVTEIGYLTTEDLKMLPSSLTVLIMAGSRPKDCTWFHLPNLSTLKFLDKALKLETEFLTSASNLVVLELPSLLTISKSAVHALPSTLTRLNLVSTAFKGEQVENLPRDLLWLDLSYCEDLNEGHLKMLPSKLTHLSISTWEESPRGVEYLPKELDYLCIISGGNDIAPPFEGLNSNLRTLKYLDFTLTPPSKEEWTQMPQNLTHLALWISFRELSASCSYLFEIMPPSLLKLSLMPEYGKLHVTGYENLPQTLQILDLGWDGVFYRAPQLSILQNQDSHNQSIGDWTSVHLAAQQGDIEQLIWMKGKGADLGESLRYGLPTRDAAEFGHFEVLKWLYEEGGVALDESSTIFGVWSCETASAAAELGHLPMLSWLADHGARLHNISPNEDDTRPAPQHLPSPSVVHIGAAKGDLNTLKWALSRGESLDLIELGMRPYDVAMQNGHEEVAQWLAIQSTQPHAL